MKKIIAILICSAYSILGFSQDQKKILFIGNSLTGFNDLPVIFDSLSNQSGKNVYVDKCYNYAQSLRQYIYNQSVIDKINEEDWDFIILQSDDITAFPDMYDIEIDALKIVENYILSNCSNTNIIYEMIWGLKDGVYIQSEGFYSYENYMNKIYDGTVYIADSLNYIIGPVGWAWRLSRYRNPDIELFYTDNAHPAYPGSYLGACVFYNLIFEEELMNNLFYGILSENDATFLQTVANVVVQNNLTFWYNPVYTDQISTDTITDTDSDTDSNDENNDTTTDITSIIESDSLNITIYPNPTNGIINLSFNNIINTNCYVEVYNLKGTKVYTTYLLKFNKNTFDINLNHLLKGMYFLKITSDKKIFIRKIIIE